MAAMMRSLSSCLDATRMCRRTERASLEKKPSTKFSQEPCVGEGELEAARRSSSEPCIRLFGDVGGMIVEDQADRGVRRIGGVDQLEKVDELAAAMAVLDQGMDFAGDEIDPGQQADRAVALVFKLAGDGRVHARLWRQVRGGRCNRL